MAEAVTEDAARTAKPETGRGFGVQFIYDALKRDILEMRLPPGSGLDETRLSERFSMSRTPVREALVRLVAEGLATTLPNRNTIVSSIDFANLPVYFDALTLMYRVTTRLAALKRTEADIARLKAEQVKFAAAVRAADALAMIGTNRDFHVIIAEAGRNRYYTELFTRLLDEGRRILRVYYSSFDDHLPDPYVAEHDLMIAAIENRDADEAERLGGRHARQIIAQLQAFLASGAGAAIALGGEN
ncbi:DNA-binding transcriptional regulator, GntR family [Kaistia soli DSM 19436]|uniref:DNA-binding transcriptional regulator, GntR family n=1 Tax=Kaistia soli DSM 19436 TaxID=1122133 RepID=A0A1M5D702_9HYPH|nr:GntR family transcriptional regulator [Kaistia soli]SHF62721.1 DNA-binding transcriptional regulator, GntR family [Kaistia soli DSM 19436]